VPHGNATAVREQDGVAAFHSRPLNFDSYNDKNNGIALAAKGFERFVIPVMVEPELVKNPASS